MITANLPILQIIVPLIAAPLSALSRRAIVSWYLALIVCAIAFAIAVTLLHQVLTHGTISYMPNLFGFMLAGYAIQQLLETPAS